MTVSNYPEENAKLIRQFLLNKGLNEYAVAGLLGNLYSESRLRPNNLQNSYETKLGLSDDEYTAKVDSGAYKDFNTDRAGYGLCQWTSSGRKTSLYNHIKAAGHSIGDIYGQLEYLWIELTGAYKKSVLNVLLNCTSVREAAEVVVCKFEIPASVIQGGTAKENVINVRTAYAQDFYNLYANKEVDNVASKLLALSAGHYKYTAGKRCAKSLDPNETREWVLNDRIADKLEKILANYDGIKILRLDDTTGETAISIQDRAKASDNANADFYLAIHHNAGINLGTGGGVVVYHYPTGRNQEQAKQLYNDVISMNGLKGNRSKPIQSTTSLYEVSAPKADAILLENGFMDSRTDTPIILTESFADKTAQGLAKFFVDYWKLTKKSGDSDNTPAQTEGYKVQVTNDNLDIFNVAGAITDKGIYTIIEEKDGMGKLKSGAGWINLAQTKRV